jgi:hypothetical protein
MTTVKMNPARAAAPADQTLPSKVLMSDAAAEHVVVDKTGRQITLKKPGLLAQYRLVKMVGGEAASNAVYMNMILPVTFVVAIDGLPVPAPATQSALEALIQRLDEHGLEACVEGLKRHWVGEEPAADLEQVKP